MKKTGLLLISALFVLFVTISCFAGTPDAYEIKVKFKSLKNQECFLGFEFGTQKYITDTAQIDEKGVAVFKGEKPLDGGIYLIITKSKDFFEFILTESKVYLETDTGDFIKNTKVIISDENKVFFSYLNFMQDNYTQKLAIEKDIKAFKETTDSIKIKPLKLKLNELDTVSKYYRTNLAKNNPNFFFVKILKTLDEPLARDKMDYESDSIYSLYLYNYFQWHFFDNVDFSDKRLLRTPVLENKIEKYLDKLTYRHPDSIKYAAARVIEKSRANDEVFKYVLPKVFNKYASSKYMGQDAIFVYLAEKYYLNGIAYWTDSSQLAKMYDRVVKVKNNLIGLKAPELIMKDTNDKYVSLNQMKSKFTVLIFWDVSCGHCKKEIPRLKQIYDSIGHHDSFDVFAVYIGTDIKEWKSFIKEYKLTWVNVSDPSNYSNFRVLYDIYSTPVVYILDEDKKIQAKRIAVDQINEIVNALKKEKLRTTTRVSKNTNITEPIKNVPLLTNTNNKTKQIIIPLTRENNSLMIENVNINGVNNLNYRFILDTGADNVLVSPEVFMSFYRGGVISKDDIIDFTKYNIADGSEVVGLKFILKEVRFGSISLKNVHATVLSQESKTSMLMGGSALKQLGKITIDYDNNKLIIIED